jgi:predicted DNA-binding ribbon-helix-helix protein
MHSRSPATKSPIVKRSVNIVGRKTSVSLEDEFWNALRKIAITQKISLRDLVLKIDNERADSGLSSAIRVYVRNNSGPWRKSLSTHPGSR